MMKTTINDNQGKSISTPLSHGDGPEVRPEKQGGETLITGAEALMRALKEEGVKTIFGYPGGSIMPVFDALYDYTRGEKKAFDHILVRHEQAATHAAEGYARVCDEVGVCIVTSGPGATNTLTGVADAMMDSTPIVVIA